MFCINFYFDHFNKIFFVEILLVEILGISLKFCAQGKSRLSP